MQTLLPAPPRSPGHGRGRQPGTLSKKHIRVHLNTGSKGRVSLGASPSFWRNRVLSPGGAGRGHPSRGPLGSWPGSGGQLEEVDDPAEGLDAPARGLPVGEAAEVAPLHQEILRKPADNVRCQRPAGFATCAEKRGAPHRRPLPWGSSDVHQHPWPCVQEKVPLQTHD
ncbi:uncharacterized protein LOC120601452 isoform X7 [Pteropus medius]|uniref:uncharacterized protein LOC120601452 isoform X7 n=1 Tax=Pteropus vampyrus TaxID=132908 RepID=UPI00196AB4F0|nr:uncharacterized protein LOC120601452 isoform X7 [Pteropus giganteus]